MILIRQAIQVLENGACCRSEHSGLHSRMTDVDQEDIYDWLRWANHVFCRCNKLYDTIVELGS
jgi:hypothetical protein